MSSVVAFVLAAPVGARAGEDVVARYRAALELEAAGDTLRAAQAYADVLRLDPEHLAARRALGHERVSGVWLAGEELKRARALLLERESLDSGSQAPAIQPPAVQTTAVLIAQALRAPEARVREAAALELKTFALPSTRIALTRALGSAVSATRVRAAESLGLLGDAAAIHALITSWEGRSGSGPRAHFSQTAQTSYIGDFDVEVA